MLNYLRIYRPLNLLFIGVAQFLCAYFLDVNASLQSVWHGGIGYLILGTLATAAFGYWINDFYDYKRDLINKPEKMALHKLSNYAIYAHFLAFLAITLYSGTMLGINFALIFGICFLILWIYSMLLKDTPGLGNLLIAGLSFLSIYIVKWQFREVDVFLLIHFAGLAGVITLIRELVKDAQDLKGDKEANAKTIPIVFGYDFTNKLIYYLVLFTVSFIAISLYYQKEYFRVPLNFVYWSYYLFFVVVPMYNLALKVRLEVDEEQYANFSNTLKYILFTGILSILFF